MSRSFFSRSLAMAVAVAILGAGASSVLAQPSVPSTTPAAPNPNDKYPEVQKALQLLSKGDIPGALAQLKEASRLHPELPSEYVMMYRIMTQANQPNAARFWLEKGVTDSPSDPEPWILLGLIALQDNRLAESELDFAKSNQLVSNYPNAARKQTLQQSTTLGMAQLAERRERWSDAETRLQDYLKGNPEDLVALQRLARAMFWQGKAGKSKAANDERIGAYDILKRAKEIDKANAAKNKTREQLLPAEAIMAQYYDAYEHQNQKVWKKSDNAEKWFKFALTQAKDDLSLRAVVTVWALENGEPDFAKEQADQALRIEKEDGAKPPKEQLYAGSIAGRMLAGYVALWQKKFPDAEKFFQDIIIEAPNDFGAKNNMAIALVEQDDPTKQRKALDYALGNYQANKENADALSTLSWVYFRMKNDQASFVMDQVLKATNGNVSNPDTATYLAYILDRNNRHYDAKQVLTNILNNGRNFSMKPEAEDLFKKVKDEKAPEASSTPKAP